MSEVELEFLGISTAFGGLGGRRNTIILLRNYDFVYAFFVFVFFLSSLFLDDLV